MMWHQHRQVECQRESFINFVLNICEELFTIICQTEDQSEDHTTLHGVNNLLNPNYKFESLTEADSPLSLYSVVWTQLRLINISKIPLCCQYYPSLSPTWMRKPPSWWCWGCSRASSPWLPGRSNDTLTGPWSPAAWWSGGETSAGLSETKPQQGPRFSQQIKSDYFSI